MLGFLLLSVAAKAAEDRLQRKRPMLPPGLKTSPVTVEGTVEKVSAVDDKGVRFRAYQARSNDNDVIVSDPPGTTDYQEGAHITHMVQRTEMKDKEIQTLRFMVLDLIRTRRRPG